MNFLTYALIAVFAQNTILSGTASLPMTLSSIKKPSRLATVSVMVSIFALLCALTILPLDYLMPIWSAYMPVRGLAVSLAALVWYRVIKAVLSKMPLLDDRIGEHLPLSALSSVVVGIPLLASENSITGVSSVVGLAIGTGLGFALAAWLIGAGLRRADNPDIPAALRGSPIMLIYIGLLAMAFSAFGGGLSLFGLKG
ncbi:MAG: hypothetical protein IJC18_04685 [Clostridia bacterium]|nr:hypothetical protein [Clostridia bacterium]